MTEEKGALQEFYDRTSNRFWNPQNGLAGRDKIVYPLIEKGKGTYLELGFGSGSLLLHVAKNPAYVKAIGVEISQQLISRFQNFSSNVGEETLRKIETAVSVQEKVPSIPGSSVDVIVAVAIIEHVLNPYVVLDELWRVARPGAMLVASVPNYAYLKHRVTLMLGNLPKTGTDEPVESWRRCGWDGMHLHTFTKRAFSILLRDCGWSPMRWIGWGEKYRFMARLRRSVPQLFSGELIAICEKKVRV